jgi:hypothetical protein
LHTLDVALRIKVAVDMTTLTIFGNDAIPLICFELPSQGIVKGSGMTRHEAQERTQRAKDEPMLHIMPLEFGIIKTSGWIEPA